MTKSILLAPALSAALMMYGGVTLAADQEPGQEYMQSQKRVYGRELMTEQERAEHHARMQAAETEQERQQIRRKQHDLMKQRASERGLNIPDEPPTKKSGRTENHKNHDGSGKGD